MKYLKKFESIEESYKDVIDISNIIIQEYDKEKIEQLFDEEIINWVDSDWNEDYDSEYDWYMDHGNGEAEDVVLDSLLSWYQNKYTEITVPEVLLEVYKILKDHYDYMF